MEELGFYKNKAKYYKKIIRGFDAALHRWL